MRPGAGRGLGCEAEATQQKLALLVLAAAASRRSLPLDPFLSKEEVSCSCSWPIFPTNFDRGWRFGNL